MTETADKRNWLYASGEMADQLRVMDWSGTPLGPREHWPVNVQITASLMFNAKIPMLLLWGPDLIQLYNDALHSLLGDVLTLGQPHPSSPMWRFNQASCERVIQTGESLYLENQPYHLTAGELPKTIYLSVAYSPLHNDHGSVEGVLITFIDRVGSSEKTLLFWAVARVRSKYCSVGLTKHPA